MSGGAEVSADASAVRSAEPAVPPWLWLWIPLFVFSLPSRIGMLFAELGEAGAADQRLTEVGLAPTALTHGAQLISFVVPAVIDALPWLVLSIGIVMTAFPAVRRKRLEQQFGLEELPPDYPSAAVDFCRHFLRQHAPNVELRVALRNPRLSALVYPLDYRSRALGVGGRLLKLWRQDCAAAEAVLTHELAHVRQGEDWLLGLGSPLETAIRLWPLYLLVFVLMPILIGFLGILAEHQGAGILTAFIGQLALAAVGLPLILLSACFWLLSNFVLPVAAIWCTEFNADRYAKQLTGNISGVLNISGELIESSATRRGRIVQSTFNVLSHPPARLRQLFVEHASDTRCFVLLLLLFAIAYVIRLVPMVGHAALVYTSIHTQVFSALPRLVANYFTYSTPLPFFLMGCMICLWPAWTLLRPHTAGSRVALSSNEWVAYGTAGTILIALGLAGWA
jgi:Zn-dependent protease with chaperone function